MVLWFVGGCIAIIILTNLIIGFATASTSASLDGRKSKKGSCACWRHSTTNCLIRFVFSLNQAVFLVALLLLVVFCIFTFALYLLTVLCNDETRTSDLSLLNHDRSFEQILPGNSINLQPFAPMFLFAGNETQQLLFKDYRLKTLCRDYVPTLKLYSLISLLGVAFLYLGFLINLLNLTSNRIRIVLHKKYSELLFLNVNGTELNTFNDTYDNGERF